MSDIINMDALGGYIDETVTGYLDENLDDIIKDSGEIEEGVELYMERNAETLVDEHMDKLDIALMVKEYLDGSPELIEAGIKDKVAEILAYEVKRVKDASDKAASNFDRFKQEMLTDRVRLIHRIDELEYKIPGVKKFFIANIVSSLALVAATAVAFTYFWG